MPNILDLIQKPVMAMVPEKEIEYGPWGQLGIATASTAGSIALSKLLRNALNLPKQSARQMIPTALGSFASGIALLPLHNALVRYKKEKQLKDAMELWKQHALKDDPGIHANNIANSFSKLKSYMPDMFKQSSLAGSAASFAGKGILGGIKAVGRGFVQNPFSKTAPIGEKIFGVATKGAFVGGAGYGTYKTINHVKNTPTSPNYTTHLRNNILHGKISPAELNGPELEAVKKVGYK